jgi:hypothetical protein
MKSNGKRPTISYLNWIPRIHVRNSGTIKITRTLMDSTLWMEISDSHVTRRQTQRPILFWCGGSWEEMTMDICNYCITAWITNRKWNRSLLHTPAHHEIDRKTLSPLDTGVVGGRFVVRFLLVLVFVSVSCQLFVVNSVHFSTPFVYDF